MSLFRVYVLDSNVFIQAACTYYAFDLLPPFWQALIRHAESGQIVSVDRVRDEINHMNDTLAGWANTEFHRWFMSTTQPDVIEEYRRIMVWASNQNQFSGAAKAEFARADNADAWVVAYAKAKGHSVVTHEQLHPDIKHRIPIPNACQAFGVEYVDTFQMLRTLGVRLG